MNDNNEQEFFAEDDDDVLHSIETQLESLIPVEIGCVDDEKDAFCYLGAYKNFPNIAFHCCVVEPATYIERYDVFEVKLNKNADFIKGFQILGCLPEHIEYVELFVRLQEKKLRSLFRFETENINKNKPTWFSQEGWKYIPCSFLTNKPEFYLEVQLKDNCPILNIVRIEIYYLFVPSNVRKTIEYSQYPFVLKNNKKLEIKEKKLILS